ncbi:Glutathione transporter 1 [Serendipita indica DSM 11827]|nr:Glutathione transporter 1 [Serendipita indica DSM 11827]
MAHFANPVVVDDKTFAYDERDAYAMGNFHAGLATEATMDDYADEEDSPYEEVRASVSNTDDPDMPVNTLRMWTIGLLLTVLGAGMNTFFIFRNPFRLIVSYAILLIAFPIGRLAAYSLPIRRWKLPKWLGGLYFSLNPGPFNIKEHVCIYMMANAAIYPTYAMNTIVTIEHYYNIHWGTGFNLCLALSTQITGFGYAGIFRRLLIWPASLIWPATLVTSTLLNTLHAEEDFRSPSSGISRYKWFLWVGGAAFVWHWLPGYLFQGLSYFSFICWFAPNNLIVNQLFDIMGRISTHDPMVGRGHIFLGFALFWWVVQPIMYYTNSFWMAYMPMGQASTYDRFGNVYNVSRVLTPDITLNLTAYEEYSQLYLSPSYVAFYLVTFAISTCILTHTALYHGKTLWNSFRNIDPEEEDIHAKLMKAYPEVPTLWYWGVVVVFFVVACAAVQAWPTKVPVYSLFLALALPAVYMLPAGLIFAVTGQAVCLILNVNKQLMIWRIVIFECPRPNYPGSLLPGNPIANMVFKCYAIETLYSAQLFTQDLKLGHYIKVPPRTTFLVQLIASFISVITQVGVKNWIFSVVPDMCSPTQKDSLTCPRNLVYFNASAIWGLVGPSQLFGPGAPYNVFLWALLAGAIAPFPLWYYQRRVPNTRLKYINLPVMLNGPSAAPPAMGINYISFFVVGFVFPIDGAAIPRALKQAPIEGFAPSIAQLRAAGGR